MSAQKTCTFSNSRLGGKFPDGWQTHARATMASMGQSMGFPSQFQYGRNARENVNAEYVNIYVNGNVGIAQDKVAVPRVGEYLPITDVPFDPHRFEREQNRLALIGFSALALGGYFI